MCCMHSLSSQYFAQLCVGWLLYTSVSPFTITLIEIHRDWACFDDLRLFLEEDGFGDAFINGNGNIPHSAITTCFLRSVTGILQARHNSIFLELAASLAGNWSLMTLFLNEESDNFARSSNASILLKSSFLLSSFGP